MLKRGLQLSASYPVMVRGRGNGSRRHGHGLAVAVRLALQQQYPYPYHYQFHPFQHTEQPVSRAAAATTTRLFSSTSGGGDDKKGNNNNNNNNMPSLEDIIQSLEKKQLPPKQQQQQQQQQPQQSRQASRPVVETLKSKRNESFLKSPGTSTASGRTREESQQQQRLRSPSSSSSSSSSSYKTQQKPQQQQEKQQQQQQNSVDWSKKVGRGWTDPWNPESLLEASMAASGGGKQQQQQVSSSSSLSLLSSSRLTYDDLPDWSPKHVSRAALERVQVHADKVPTLDTLAKLPLPPPPAYAQPGLYPGQYVSHSNNDDNDDNSNSIQKQHTRNKRLYGRHRQEHLYQQVQKKVIDLAEPQIPAIVALSDWQDKQNAIDDLFESVEVQLQQSEIILGKHPSLGSWVERALEEYLASLVAAATSTITNTNTATAGDATSSSGADESSKMDKNESTNSLYPTQQEDEASVPIFMDCHNSDVDSSKNSSSSNSSSSNVDNSSFPAAILRPLRPYERAANQGRMLEEWELAAHDTTKRILLRQSTRQVARILTEHYDKGNNAAEGNSTTLSSSSSSPRILVTGRQGVGKSAALASIVASARKSGHVVWYMPDCNQLHQNGYYIEPNDKTTSDSSLPLREKLYDLPVLSQQACRDLHASHGMDLQKHNLKASITTLQKFFTQEQLDHVPGAKSGASGNNEINSIPLVDLLKLGLEKTAMGPMCLSTVIHVLMHEQDVVPFTIVVDEFNVLYAPGKYFHQDYDETVKNAIPYDQITLFRPILQAMGLPSTMHNKKNKKSGDTAVDTPIVVEQPVAMKRGAIVAGLTESCAVARQVTDTLVARAQHEASSPSLSPSPSLHVVHVPRLTEQEVYCMLANYEAIGIGKLRLDQGETILNPQEVAFLQTVSGSVPQLLMNACIL